MPRVVLLVLVVAALAVPSATAGPEPPQVPNHVAPATSPLPEVRAAAVLRAWDRRRAAAYASGDSDRLRALYAPASRAGAKDARLLRSYASRGLAVDQLVGQLLRVRLLDTSSRLLRIKVRDRVVASVAGRVGEGTVLPTGPPRHRLVTLVRTGAGWVVRSVRRP